MYSEEVKSAFLEPHHLGKMKNPDGFGTVGNIVCGDVMYLYIKVGINSKGKEFLKDVKWETFGCAAAIATSSTAADQAIGKTLEEAIEMTNQGVVSVLGGLPTNKIHCSILAVDALHEAIFSYLEKKGSKVPEKLLKRHEVIQKEMDSLKEKYSEYMEMQKGVLDK